MNENYYDKSVCAHGFTLKYRDKDHKYWIESPSGDSWSVYGCTTMLKVLSSIQFDKKTGAATSKSDTLMNWAVSEVKKALLAGQDIETATKAHTKKSDFSKNFGHKVHSIIELASHAHNEGHKYSWGDTPEDTVAKRIFDNDVKTNTKVLAQELLVFMPSNPNDPPEEWKDWIAGTFDRLVLRDGKVELQDHKTSSGVYDLNYFVQLRGYQEMLEWMMKDKNNTYANTLDVLYHQPIEVRRINLSTKTGFFTDEWLSTNHDDDSEMLKATKTIFNISKKYKHLFWEK